MPTELPTFSVTLIKTREAGVPLIARGEYMYEANWLPHVGDTIPLSRRDGTDSTARAGDPRVRHSRRPHR